MHTDSYESRINQLQVGYAQLLKDVEVLQGQMPLHINIYKAAKAYIADVVWWSESGEALKNAIAAYEEQFGALPETEEDERQMSFQFED